MIGLSTSAALVVLDGRGDMPAAGDQKNGGEEVKERKFLEDDAMDRDEQPQQESLL